MKIKNILGYVWAIFTIPLAFIIIGASDTIGDAVFGDVKVTDRISGGEIVKVVNENNYSICIHEMVFDGFIFEHSSGFVQIDFISEAVLPSSILEEIDYNLDGIPDFSFFLNTESNEYELIPFTDKVKGLSDEGVYVFDDRRTVRVNIDR